ncbi:MAG: preprotein translocase subunit TatC [Methanosarcinales archaeon]|nr:MAG: preprotein translocase subunit TatC [Methanosarcinales archaeon]
MALNDFNFILVKLRRKLMYIAMVVGIGTLGSFPFMSHVLNRIKVDLTPPDVQIVVLTPTEAILLELKMALIIGILLALPFIAYYAHGALKERGVVGGAKKSFALLVSILAVIMFFLGISYSYFIMLPIVLGFLNMLAAGTGALSNWSLESYIYFVVMMSMAFGLVFEMPIVLPLLVRSGLVEYQTLAGHRKHAVVLIFLSAAMITPPDVVSQLMIGLPMILFYELSLLIIRLTTKTSHHPMTTDGGRA